MAVRKYIVSVVMVFVLNQSAVFFFSILSAGKASSDDRAIMSIAWAEDEPLPQPDPIQNQESQQFPDSVGAPAGQQVPATSIDENNPTVQDSSSNPQEIAPKVGYVDLVQAGISRRVLATAQWLDSFFADKRTTREINQSYLQLRYDIFVEDGTEQTIQMPSLNFQLRLPELERLGRKVNLVFESEPAAAPDGAPSPISNTGAQVRPAETRSTSAALHFLVGKTAEQSFIIRTGSQFNMEQSALFIAPRYRLLIPLKTWDFRFTQDVIYRTDTQWQTETLFDLERKLPHDLFFRSFIDGIWQRSTDDYFYTLGFSLLQPIDPTNAVLYGWSNSFTTKPSLELSQVNLSIQYRHSIWRKWLFFEVIPQCRFPRSRDFSFTPGILFRFEMYFGHTEM